MRILHCIATLGEGGSELQVSRLASAQARAGLDVHLAVRREGPYAAGLRAAGVSLHRLQSLENHNPMLYWKLADLVARLRPGVLQTWLPQMDILGGLAARQRNVPWVLTEQSSSDCHTSGLKSAARAYLARSARAVVSNSHGGEAYWASRIGPRARHYVIPNILLVEEIQSAGPIAAETIGLPPDHFMVLVVGRLSPEKNLANLLRALRHVPLSLPIVLYFCGVGPDEAGLRRLAESERLDQRIRFAGFVSPVSSWMKRADVYVSASLYEGQPNAVLEAMAAGCPAVLSDIAAHRELLDDRSAVFVDPYSPASIAEGLRRCLENREEATQRAALAQGRVAEHSANDIAKMYQAVYDDVLGGARVVSSAGESACAG